jgi:hypothetical protein
MTQNPSFELCVESGFYKEADALRTELDQQILSVQHAGTRSPFVHLFAANEYQCITASADRIFERDVLLRLMTRIRQWAEATLGARHATTPRLTIYMDGCWRRVLQDEVRANWHYILCLTSQGKQGAGHVKIGAETSSNPRSKFNGDDLKRVRLIFNQVLVHETRWPWGIDDVKPAREPIEAMVLLDGYLW